MDSSSILTRSRVIQLLTAGAGLLAIYIFLVAVFPLIPNTLPGGPAADVEILLRNRRGLAALVAAGVAALYFLFWGAITVARVLPDSTRTRWLVLGVGLAQALALVFLYPITALDLFLYAVLGRTWAVHGFNPMLVAPAVFPNDPYVAFAGEFAEDVSPYGPLWEVIVQLPLRLGAVEIVPAVIALKLIAVLAYCIIGLVIGWGWPGRKGVTPLVALVFYAWNPLILMQWIGNGHNDAVMFALIMAGLWLNQRGRWAAAVLAVTLAMLVKVSAVLILPLLGLAILRDTPTWRRRVLKAGAITLIVLGVALAVYAAAGPFPDIFEGVGVALLNRRGYTPASAARLALRILFGNALADPIPRTLARDLFIVYYGWLAFRLWSGRVTLAGAGFAAFFSQIVLGSTFRIWYPTWLAPLAALALTDFRLWRTLLFGLTAELSILSYFILWRWIIRYLAPESGLLAEHWNYYTVMTLLNVPWVFGIPLFGPIWLKWRRQRELTF